MEKMQKRESDTIDRKVPVILSKRWVLAYIGMLGFCVLYALRVNMSVAIICMVRNTNDTGSGDTSTNSTCGALDKNEEDDRGEFDWDKTTQSFILSTFFYGYLVTQIPGGWVAGRYGGKLVLGGGILITSMATLLIPVSARWDYRMVIALRILMGVAEGVSFPGMHSMWGRWAPPGERTLLTAFTYSGTNIGNVVTFIVAGLLCADGFDHGWGSVFYVTGGVGVLWSVCWFYLVSNTPDTHPTITKAERDYIIQGIGHTNIKKFKMPWRAALTSRALLVCLVAHVCKNWLHYTLLTGLPTFMKKVLRFDIKQNGVLSAVPYMVMAVTSVASGQLADFLRSRWLSTTITRRLFQSISFLCSGALIVGVGFVSCDHRDFAVILLALGVGFQGLSSAGYMVNQVDFAARYAGVLYGITNVIATIPGILAPTVIGALTPNKTQEEWRNVFYICGAFSLTGAIIFGGFAQGEVQPWALEVEDPAMSGLPCVGEDEDKSKVNKAFDYSYSLETQIDTKH